MPPKRKVRGGAATGPKRRPAPRKETNNDIPDLYLDMLAEVAHQDIIQQTSPRKRRKLSTEESRPVDIGTKETLSPNQGTQRDGFTLQQTVLDDFSASSDDEDADFEDVDIGTLGKFMAEDDNTNDNAGVALEQKPLAIDLSKHPLTSTRRSAHRRRTASPAERALRLSVHKTHLLLLLISISRRNGWCESYEAQRILKPLVRKKTIKQLHLDHSEPQWKRSTAFNDAIKEIAEIWRTAFNINVRGMRRAHWRSEINMQREMDEAEDILDFEDFKTAAYVRSGSRDLGAQLFCALLRACGVDTRLVCSLQVLPFSASATQQAAVPEELGLSTAKYIHAPTQDYGSSRRSASSPEQSKTGLDESPYPVFWVEVFSPAISTWIPVDPLVRNTFNKAKTGFEPPASDPLNAMSYVIAFEGDNNSARDVTRRYAQWFNAKTRKTRVESTKGGAEWYASVMNFFAKPFSEDRDAIEDIDLARRNELEGMPKSIQDFKGHPLYVLERHLHLNEVIHPRREAGRVPAGGGGKSSAGAASKKFLEPVFRRKDVHICRSADAWYRRGRDVKPGETALKHAVSMRQHNQQQIRRDGQDPNSDEEEENKDAMALYAEFQTQPYIPPPVVDERVPRNAFGNLDVYVPSMIPAGAIHVRHPLAAKAAQILGIDYAIAVTGFEFKGRHGTAVVDGVVVSAKQRVAMVTVIVGLQNQEIEEVERQRSRVALAMWKKWLAALRIKQQIAKDYGDEKQNVSDDDEEEDNSKDSTYHQDDGDTGGGFFAEEPGDNFSSSHGNDNATSMHGNMPLLSPAMPNDQLLLGEDLLPPSTTYHEIIVIESPNNNLQPTTPAKLEFQEFQELPPIATTSATAQDSEEDYLFGGGGDEKHSCDETSRGGDFVSEPNDSYGVDEGGGGFVVEESMTGGLGTESQVAIKGPRSPPMLKIRSSGGGGVDIDDCGEFVESALPSSDSKIEESKNENDNDNELEEEHEHALETLSAIPQTPPPLRSESTPSSILVEDGDDEDRLSHDPDEDEAEPEWLNESLGIDG